MFKFVSKEIFSFILVEILLLIFIPSIPTVLTNLSALRDWCYQKALLSTIGYHFKHQSLAARLGGQPQKVLTHMKYTY